MRLAGLEGSLELSLVGYEFPDLATVEYDSNWLNVRVRVEHPRGTWSAQDPCLLTYEAAELADWLHAVAAGREPEAEYDGFLEPNLRFEVRADSAGERVLRVYFDLEFRPKWASCDGATEDVFIDVPAERSQLSAAADSLRLQLAQYPQRTER